ncbi:MAG: hypothetical protein M1820_007422 [Bogoriella megaspora]|nr:MAG: hypothetical protein M1820_007422 [Bogoriella megaspora]
MSSTEMGILGWFVTEQSFRMLFSATAVLCLPSGGEKSSALSKRRSDHCDHDGGGSPPPLCSDDITPNDMHSNVECAWTGALVLTGGMGLAMWIFLRALWMHLRVCWDVMPGKFFFWFSHLFGWGTIAVILTAALAATGVSYRIAGTCLPNHPHTVADFWAWLITFAGLAIVTQLATSGYCIWVYIRHLLAHPSSKNVQSTVTTGTSTSGRHLGAISAKATWQKVHKVLVAQWRGLVLSILIIIESGYFTAIFLREDVYAASPMGPARIGQLEQWALCLITSGGDKNACLGEAKELTLDPAVVLASEVVVSFIGIEILLLLGRPSIFKGWLDLLRYGDRQRDHEKESKEVRDAFVVDNRKPSCVPPLDDLERGGGHDLEKGFENPRLDSNHQDGANRPLLGPSVTADLEPTQTSLPPTPLPKDPPKRESMADVLNMSDDEIAPHMKVPETHASPAASTPDIIEPETNEAEASDQPKHSRTKRRSRFLEARFSRDDTDQPPESVFQTQPQTESKPQEELLPAPPPIPREVRPISPRPISSPVLATPRITRSPNRPLSGLWRSLSKTKRDAEELRAGRGGLGLNPVVKDDEAREK